MNTAVAVNTSNGSPKLLSSMQEVPLIRIRESKTNPRRQFDESKLAELADNIRLHGVLQPVLVRPMPDGEDGHFELVAGARRYRASKLAGKETIPATVRRLSDTECLELQLIENLQRADVHELDEARGYAALMQLQPDTYTVEVLAEKIGRSEKYVYARLRLTHLVEEIQQAFYTGKLTVAHAFEIARLQPEDQRRALAECFPQHRTTAAVLKDKKAEAVTVRSLREWIEREIHLDISHAPFDAQDEKLVPAAGSCAACPKRTGNNPLLPDVLYEGQYRRIAKKGECPHTKAAVVVDGTEAGTLLHVCRDEKCPVHARETRYQPTPQERAARAKELLAERVEKQTRIRILNLIRQKLPGTLARPDLEMAALEYFRRLGHDNHRCLCRAYGWEEKKSKASWGGMSVGSDPTFWAFSRPKSFWGRSRPGHRCRCLRFFPPGTESFGDRNVKEKTACP